MGPLAKLEKPGQPQGYSYSYGHGFAAPWAKFLDQTLSYDSE